MKKKLTPKLSLHTIIVHLHNILEMTKLLKGRTDQLLPETRDGWGQGAGKYAWEEKDHMRDPGDYGSVLYFVSRAVS